MDYLLAKEPKAQGCDKFIKLLAHIDVLLIFMSYNNINKNKEIDDEYKSCVSTLCKSK